MGTIVVTEFVSLDGVFEDPGGAEGYEYGGWTFEYDRGDEGNTFKLDELMDAKVQLLGRVTYEGFAEAWPGRTAEDDEGAEFMNNVRKYVLSSTLTEVGWNNSTLLTGDPAEAVRTLKASPGGDIMTSGSPTAVRWLLSEGLVDELNLLLYPVVVGRGKRLFPDAGPSFPMELKKSTAFGNGVVQLTYVPS